MPHLSARNVPATAVDSLQALVSLFKVDSTDSAHIGTCRCQMSEEQIYQSSLLNLTAELDLVVFAHTFEITDLHAYRGQIELIS